MQHNLLDELQESEARFRAAFQSSAIGMGLLSLDGKILQVNDAVLKMSGYTEEELLQRYDQENVYIEDREVGMDLFQELLEGKRDRFQVEKRYVRKNGDVFWARLTLSAVRDPHGQPLYLVGLIEDIDEQKRLLNHLQDSEARVRSMFENAAVGVGVMGLDRKLLDANPALCRIYGRTREELIGMNAAEVTYPDDNPLSRQLVYELMAGQRDAYEMDRRYIRKNGEVFWAHVTMSSVRGADGKPLYLVGMVIDIDEQKKMQERIRESEARFRVMFENAGIGIALIGMDRRPLEANAALIEMTGYTPEEFFQKNSLELSYPEDAGIGLPELQAVLDGKLNTYQIEKRYVRKSGQIYWVRLTNSVVRGVDGKPQYFVTMVEDIDEKKKMQERVRESEARFQAIFDNVAVGVAVMTLERRPISINATTAKILGYNLDELIGVDPRSLAIPEDRNIDNEWFQEMIDGRRNSYVMERRYRRKSGQIFWARVNYSLVCNSDGRPDYVIGIIEDIDDQKRVFERLAEQEADYLRTLQQKVQERTRELEEANQQLQREIEQRVRIEKELAQKAAEEAVTADRTRLARDLHDAVTQTLFSASLTAEVLPELWEMDVDEAKRSTEELRQLARGALAEMRTLLLELRPAALTQSRLSDLIRQLCEAFIGRSRLPITLTIEGERDLPPEVQIACYRVAQEGLNNVFKYARATKVDVNLFLSPAGLHFEVCDNGIGFDMTTSKPTSLGMRIMRERAEAIGADLHISSTPGSGTCLELNWTENPNLKLRVL